MSWYRSQWIVAGILALYELVALIWLADTTRFFFPFGNFLGFFAVVGYIPGLIISLLINQEVLVYRGNPVVSQRERRLLAAEFAVVALSLVALAIPRLLLENLVLWFAVVVLAALVLRRLRAKSE